MRSGRTPKTSWKWRSFQTDRNQSGPALGRSIATLFSLVALLVSMVAFTALPASAHSNPGIRSGWDSTYNGTWPPNTSSLWNRPASNPAIAPACGMDIGILIDRSGSIYDAGQADTMRNSAKAIVSALAGTPSSVGVWSFGSGSSTTGTSDYPARQLTPVGGVNGPAGVAALDATIQSIPIVTNVATNWEAGFSSVHSATLSSGKAPDLLFVLTDGKPTVHDGDTTTGSVTNNADVDGGIRTANLVKGDGTRVFGVGVGAGIDASTLGLIANPEKYSSGNFTTAGYTLTSFSELESTLRQLVLELCGGTVTVEKLVGDQSGVFTPGVGWKFDLTGVNPNLPMSATTGSDGQVNFDVDDLDPSRPSTVILTEDPANRPGYRLLVDDLVCTNSNGPDPTLTAVPGGVSFALGVADIVHCTFKNVPDVVDLGIGKSDGGATTVPGGNVTYTLTYGNKGTAAAPGTTITDIVPANTVVDLGSGPTDGRNDGWICGGSQSGVWPAGTTCSREVGTVAAGAAGLTTTITLTVVDPVPLHVTEIVNTATIDYDQSAGPDVNPSDNTSTDTTPVETEPAISLVKTAVEASASCPGIDGATLVVDEGQPVRYCYAVTNTGNTPLLNVTLTDDNATPGTPGDDFDVVLTGLVDADGDGQADDLAVGATATGQSPLLTFQPGTYVNRGTASGASAIGTKVQATDDATVTVDDVAPSIEVTKAASRDSVPEPGAPVDFTVTIHNTSAEDVWVTSITDSVNAGAPFDVTAVAPPVSATSCATGAMIGAGATYTCVFRVEVSGNAGDVVADTVVATVVDDDNSTASDDDDATVTVTPVIDLAIVKRSDPTVFTVGQPATYWLDVVNNGPSVATGVVVRDEVPAGLTLRNVVAPNGWSCSTEGAVVTCTTAQLEPGAPVTIEVTVIVGADAPDRVTNVANVTGDEPDSDETNNTSEVTNDTVDVRASDEERKPDQTPAPLPRTGRDLTGLVETGLVLIGAGAITVMIAGRRRRRPID